MTELGQRLTGSVVVAAGFGQCHAHRIDIVDGDHHQGEPVGQLGADPDDALWAGDLASGDVGLLPDVHGWFDLGRSREAGYDACRAAPPDTSSLFGATCPPGAPRVQARQTDHNERPPRTISISSHGTDCSTAVPADREVLSGV